MIYHNFESMILKMKKSEGRKKMVVAVAEDYNTLEAVIEATNDNIIDPIFVGDEKVITNILSELNYQAVENSICDESNPAKACEKAVSLVRNGTADFLMKGKVDTNVILKAVVDKEKGLQKGDIMSHFAIFEVPTYHKLLVCVDGGMVPYPTLEEKKNIIDNTVSTLHRLGYDNPKIGVLACVEKVNPHMPETVEGEQLKEMNKSGTIKGCIVEGPISYDCAVDSEIAAYKNYKSPVAGDVDVLLAPNIHAGNIIGKMLQCTCKAKMAGFIVGAKCPIAMISRAASAEEKYLSIVVAASSC